MNIKKLIIYLFLIISAFAIFITWHNREYVSVSTLAMNRYEIYLITMDKEAQFWYTMDNGAKTMADMLGVRYLWDAPEKRNVEEQIDILNKAVEAGADAIMLAASDPVRMSSAVEDAKAKGVKIIYVDSAAVEEAVTTLATDNYNAGTIAGETMISELGAVGINSGSIGIIGVAPENLTTVNRDKGFREVIAQDGRFVLLETKYSQESPGIAQAQAKAFMSDNTDLVGLFATNESATVGLGNAIQASNKKIIGIGFDITETIQNMVQNDILQAVLVQNPFTMGYLGMAEAVAALRGYDTGPPFINTGVSVITKYQPPRPIVR